MKSLLTIIFFTVSLVVTGQKGEWKILETKGAPTSRHECGLVSLDGKLYLIGGRGEKPVNIYDPESNTWSEGAYPPVDMHHIQPVAWNGKIYVAAGLSGGYPLEQPLSHVYSYDPDKDLWAKELEIPENRRRGGAGVAVYDDRIYIGGGITLGHTSGTNNFFDVYDPAGNNWEVLPTAPYIRDHCSAAVLGNKLYLIGGRNTSHHEPENFGAFMHEVINTVDVFDFENGEWKTLGARLPEPTGGGFATAFNGKVLYIGGETGQIPAHGEVQSFDPETGLWSVVSHLRQGRHGTGAVVVNGKLYTAAGSGNHGGGPELNSIETFVEE